MEKELKKKEEVKKKVENKKESVKSKEFKHLVRVSGTVLDGNKDVARALTSIEGIGSEISKSILRVIGFDRKKKLGNLSEKEIEKIEKTIETLPKLLPSWMLNRKRDYESGKNIHLTGPDLKLAGREDINREKRIKSYRGVRHSLGLPVRGQRTRTSFRKGTTVGVIRKKALKPASKEERGGKK